MVETAKTPQETGTGSVLAIAAMTAAMGAVIILAFDAGFAGLSYLFASQSTDDPFSMMTQEATIRIAGASGVVATLVSLPLARPLLRLARRSTAVTATLFVVGAVGMYVFVPRVWVYVNF